MKKKASKPVSRRERSYPSVLDLAMRAGKWSVLVGGGALIIGGATGCEEETSTPGVIALDGWVDEGSSDNVSVDNGLAVDSGNVDEGSGVDYGPTLGLPDWEEYEGDDGVQNSDVVEVDQGIPLAGEPPIDIIEDPGDVVTPDVDTDPGLLGDPIVDSFIGGSDVDAVDVADVPAE